MKTKDIALLALGAASNKPHTEYVTKEVHEHRAPTDDSIRLAREYEQKCWESIAKRVIEPLPNIDASFVISEMSAHDMSTRVFFKVNNKPISVRIEHGFDMQYETMRAIAEEITKEVMTKLLLTKYK